MSTGLGTRISAAHASSRHTEVQAALLIVGVGCFLVTTLWLGSRNLLAALIGAAAIVGSYSAGRSLGPRESPGKEPAIVFGAACILFVAPVFTSLPPHGTDFVAAAIGAFVAQGAWALHRYPYDATRAAESLIAAPFRVRIERCVARGLWFAGGLSMFAAVIFIIAFLTNAQPPATADDFAKVCLGYLSASVIGGTIVGAAAPLIRWPLGAIAIGVPFTIAIYGCVGVAISTSQIVESRRTASDVPTGLVLAAGLLMATIGGPMWGIMVKEWIEDG